MHTALSLRQGRHAAPLLRGRLLEDEEDMLAVCLVCLLVLHSPCLDLQFLYRCRKA